MNYIVGYLVLEEHNCKVLTRKPHEEAAQSSKTGQHYD